MTIKLTLKEVKRLVARALAMQDSPLFDLEIVENDEGERVTKAAPENMDEIF